MAKPYGADSPFLRRYVRQHDVLYVEAQHQEPSGEYLLLWRYADGTSRATRLPTFALVYDALHKLEQDLWREGWELLPANFRAPNRLITPTCKTCQTGQPVETSNRTVTHVHFRCAGCGHLWIIPKPGVVWSGPKDQIVEGQSAS